MISVVGMEGENGVDDGAVPPPPPVTSHMQRVRSEKALNQGSRAYSTATQSYLSGGGLLTIPWVEEFLALPGMAVVHSCGAMSDAIAPDHMVRPRAGVWA